MNEDVSPNGDVPLPCKFTGGYDYSWRIFGIIPYIRTAPLNLLGFQCNI